VRTANQSFYEAFGVTPEQTKGRLIFELGNGQWRIPALRQLLEDILPAKRSLHDYEVTHQFENLGPRTMLLNARQVDYEQTIILAFLDITERKRAEELAHQAKNAMARHTSDLEKAVEVRTAALRETVRELEAFSYSMVHDMRAPLRAMNSFARMLHEEYGTHLDDTGREYLARICNSAERLDLLILDVLNYTHVLRDEAPMSPVNLEELLRELLATYPGWQPPQAEVQIVSPIPSVLGHKALLAQCISHLVGNAIKFVAPGVQPRIRIWAQEVQRTEGRAQSAGSESPPPVKEVQPLQLPHQSTHPLIHSARQFVRINVEDNGIGIAPENRDRVFAMFQRIHPASQYEGTGIGLTIVRRAAERMGGQVGYDSEPGKGSIFWVELRRGGEE
jgi:signal transduction histidine kinase